MGESTRGRRARVRRATRSLWRELCRAHGLTFLERRALVHAARGAGYATPAALFFKPSVLTNYVRAERERLSRSTAQRLTRLAKILFADCREAGALAEGPLGDDGLPHRFAPEELGQLVMNERALAPV